MDFLTASTRLLLGALMLAGCAFSADAANTGIDDDYMDDPQPPAGCRDDCPNEDTEGAPVGDPCLNTRDCADDAVCVAGFDGDVQEFLCEAACVPLMDETRWCADDDSCCPGTSCSPRGLCRPAADPPGADSGSSDDGTSGSSTTEAGATDTGATGTGGSSGSTGENASTG